jgi:hypothetical protein
MIASNLSRLTRFYHLSLAWQLEGKPLADNMEAAVADLDLADERFGKNNREVQTPSCAPRTLRSCQGRPGYHRRTSQRSSSLCSSGNGLIPPRICGELTDCSCCPHAFPAVVHASERYGKERRDLEHLEASSGF